MIDAEFRPLTEWPGTLTPDTARKGSPFRATYSQTLELLDHELRQLKAQRVVIELALSAGQIRADGWPRADARTPTHPGVIVSFDSTYGPLRYLTDRYTSGWANMNRVAWQQNLRAIALGLEALRKVDRYGISERGEQYTGWSALPPGTIAAAAGMTVDEAARYVQEAGHPTASDTRFVWEQIRSDADIRERLYRQAAKRLHPDTASGNEAGFRRLEQAITVLRGAA